MKLKLVTYNIHRAIGLDRRFKPKRIIEILKDIDADIVLLQEVDEGAPRSKELNLAKEIAQACDYPYFQLGHNVTLKKGNYGNATLSRFPILNEKNIDLTIDNKKCRGSQYTQLKIQKKTKSILLEVFNLHLGLSATERQKQAGVLFHSKEFRKIQAKTPTIIAGDFNDWRSLLRALFVEGFDFTCATDTTKLWGESALKTFPSFAPRGGLDRVYYKGRLKHTQMSRYQDKKVKIASDHLPVVVEFVI